MTDLSMLANALELAILLIILAVVMFKLMPSMRLDQFRQEMFGLRDELFDYAATGNISFSHPAYRLLRRSMNGHIRYAHQLTFFRLCLTLINWRFAIQKPKAEWSTEWEAALGTIRDEKIRSDLQRFHSRAMTLIVRRVVLGSPVLIVAVVLVTLVMLVGKGVRNIREVAKSAASTVLSGFIEPELIDEEAARCAA